MTYCLGIVTDDGLVMASDSRTNAGFDQVNVCRKMHRFVQPGERAFVILCSGSLSISQSVITLLRGDFDSGKGLAQVTSLYEAARVVGDMVRRVGDIDRAPLERDDFRAIYAFAADLAYPVAAETSVTRAMQTEPRT